MASGKAIWWIYAILFFVPDLSFAAYLAGPRTGALVYNAAHSYLAPVAMMTGGFATASPLLLSIAMIWLAHIGFDRALGYGLKYAAASASRIWGGSASFRTDSYQQSCIALNPHVGSAIRLPRWRRARP